MMQPPAHARGLDYRSAGVDIDASEQAKQRIRALVESTYRAKTRGAFGEFGGMFRMPTWMRKSAAGPIQRMVSEQRSRSRSKHSDTTACWSRSGESLVSTTSSCKERRRCSSWTMLPSARSIQPLLRASSPVSLWDVARMAARSWGEKRRKCQVSIRHPILIWRDSSLAVWKMNTCLAQRACAPATP